MTPEGALNLAMVPRQAKILAAQGVSGAFVCGSTGESHSLTTAERMRVAEAWATATRATSVKLIVHAGHNCLEDAKALAAHAAGINADAVAAMAPCYFKPGSPQDLAAFCAGIAAAAPSLPFYFYDIPSMTGVELPMPEFLKHAGRIPNFAGLKFTSADLMSLQRCLELEGGRYNVLFGSDEMLLAALALGAHGAVGSTYNYAAPLYQNILKAFRAGDMEQARTLQMKSVQLVEVLCRYGVLAGGKALMALVGADCGPVRLPLRPLTGEQIETLRQEVESLGVLAAAPRNAVPA
jgi:N-acetylneuraminate lyase